MLASYCIRVYIHSQSQHVDEVRNTFLGYVGGQHHAICEKHGKPLIVSLEGECHCNAPCPTKRIADWRCIDPTCSVAICKEHYFELKAQAESQPLPGGGTLAGTEQLHFQVGSADMAPAAAAGPAVAGSTVQGNHRTD